MGAVGAIEQSLEPPVSQGTSSQSGHLCRCRPRPL